LAGAGSLMNAWFALIRGNDMASDQVDRKREFLPFD
jgi:hypothetical protein